jgi:lipocalin
MSKKLEYYKQYVGEKELTKLLSRFDATKFCDTWNQVMTSRSTILLGSGGSEYSSVTATYSALPKSSEISVLNKCYDEKHNPKFIQGISRCIDSEIPTCRTVFFPSVGATGDYWILYMSKNKRCCIICCPLIIPYTSIKLLDNLALYVLAKDRNEFWADKKLVDEIYDVLRKYKFDLFINEPIYSGV